MLKRAVLLLLAVMLVSCSSSTGARYTSGRQTNIITAEEITTTSSTNAYDLIRSLRPLWLRGRGQKSIYNTTASYPVVYVNGVRYGTPETLSGISTANITLVKFLNTNEATILYGLDHASGAIMITISY